MNIKKKLGNRVRALRISQGFSQEELALRVGVHRTYMGAIERGERNISLENIEKIANALKIEIKDLFNE
ncbi:MAG: helix-turn-helix domain-containing protein [Candidatus Lokiarchaeota archaeon]|nr:helix-turn-helix domain-containing protein [Candidatus Lokiarchaeota archaeon]